MIVFEKFGQHQPLNRQADRYALEGVTPWGVSLRGADAIRRLVEAHVMAAERLHGDDTTVPVLAKGKTDTGRCSIYVRDDRPFGGMGPPAAMFHYSRDRKGEHMPASCRRMPMMAIISSTSPGEIKPDPGSGVLGARSSPVLCHGRS